MTGVEEGSEGTDRCPACEREFTSLYDYPRVYISKIVRTEAPADLKIPGQIRILFVHPAKEFGNAKLPQRVVELFGSPLVNGSGQEYVEDKKGWSWSRFADQPEATLDQNYFRLFRQDVSNIICLKADKFLTSLNEMTGREVSTQLLHPPKLPIVQQFLTFAEVDTTFGERRSEDGFRKANLLLKRGSVGGIYRIINFGTLYYEGRIN